MQNAQNTTMAFLSMGRAAKWRVTIADAALEYVDDGEIYQQAGVGNMVGVIHSAPNYGEPHDSARHRAAQAIWNAVENMSMPRNKKEKVAMIAKLRGISVATE